MPTGNESMLLTWHIVDTIAEYLAGTPNPNDLYFINDTKQIYRGADLFDQAYDMYADGAEPTVKAKGRIYFNSTTLEGKVWDGTNFNTVIKPISSTVTADGAAPVSGAAVANYVAATSATRVYWDEATGSLTICDASDNILDTAIIDGLAASLNFDSATNEIYINDATGTKIGTGIKLDLERFVTGAEYDAVNKNIILYFDGKTGAASADKITIPVADLVDTYTVSNGKTITLTMVDNAISAEVKLSAEEGNALVVKTDGLYVTAGGTVDISGKMDKVASATAGNLVGLDADGNAVDSGKKVGGAILAATPDANTLATEAAVKVIVDTLTINLGAAKANELVIVGADGSITASGKKVGGATFAATPDANTLATEAGTLGYVSSLIVTSEGVATTVATASETKTISEKAFVEGLSWKAGM